MAIQPPMAPDMPSTTASDAMARLQWAVSFEIYILGNVNCWASAVTRAETQLLSTTLQNKCLCRNAKGAAFLLRDPFFQLISVDFRTFTA